MGSAKAAVLPVPVCAVPIRSFPARTIGKARSWIGVGSEKPIACVPRTTSDERPKSLNDTGGSYSVLAHDTTVQRGVATASVCARVRDGAGVVYFRIGRHA